MTQMISLLLSCRWESNVFIKQNQTLFLFNGLPAVYWIPFEGMNLENSDLVHDH